MATNAAVIVDVFYSNSQITIEVAACLAALGLLNWLLIFFSLVLLFRKATAEKNGNTKEQGQVKLE